MSIKISSIKNYCNQNRNKLSILVRVVVSSALLLYLFNRIEWPEILKSLQSTDYRYIIAAFIVTKLAIVVSALKWYILCRATSDVSFMKCLRWCYIGFFFSNFLPGSIGGDAPRVYYASKKMGFAHSLASITVERIFAGVALVVTASVGFVVVQGMGENLYPVLLLAAIFLLLYFAIFNNKMIAFMTRRFGKSVKKFYEAIEIYKGNRNLLLKLFIFSMIFQICFVWITDLLFRSQGIQVSFQYQLAVVSIISAITMLPISMNGLGVREGSYAYFFALIGVAESTSVSVSLLFYFTTIFATSIGGIVWMLEKRTDKGLLQNETIWHSQ